MSTLEDLSKSKVTIFVKPKENILQSLASSLATLSILGLFIYASQGSAWWTLVTGLMFIAFLSARTSYFLGKNYTTFKDSDAAIKYLNGLGL